METLQPTLKRGRDVWDRTNMPEKEFRSRVEGLRSEMKKEGIDLLFLYGRTTDHYANPAYISNFLIKTPQGALVAVPDEGDVTLIVEGFPRDQPAVKSITWIQDIRSCREISKGCEEYMQEKDPQNPEDDIEKEVLETEVGVPIVLDGIVFAISSAEIKPESETILTHALNTLQAYPDMVVEIHGHTDITGSREFNMTLSQKRADSVKAWLIENGIEEERLVAKGFGPDNPIAPNTTREGRQQNRRIEFFRVK